MTALIITLGVFITILVMSRLKVPLSLAIMAGAVLIGFLFGLSSPEVAGNVLAGATQAKTIALAAITVLLLSLSILLQISGRLEEIVKLARLKLGRPALAMAALPALIGLLPMPGGALVSAPMVRSAAGDSEIDGHILSAINYWFRHIWEHFWPLYPGVMLAVTLTESPYGKFIVFQMPLGIFAALAGLLLFRGTGPDLHKKSQPAPAGTGKKLLRATSSIWIIILVWLPGKYVIGSIVVPFVPEQIQTDVGRYAPLACGLLTAIILTVISQKLRLSAATEIYTSRTIYTITPLVISVLVLQYMLAETGAAEKIASELVTLQVPMVLVAAILPFIAGMVTGLAVAFVGTSFPIVLALVTALPEHGSVYPYVALAYGFGHLGMMLSPLHLCHVLSNEYFKTAFIPVYRRMLPCVGVTAVLVTAYFFLLKMVT